jgi:hypothetical protein
MTRSRSNLAVAVTTDHEVREAAASERALLGTLLQNSSVMWPAIKDLVNASHIMRPDHRLIFGAISALIEEGVAADVITVIDRLHSTKQLPAAGGNEYIAELVQEAAFTPETAIAYAKTVRKHAGRGEVVDLAERMAARSRMGSVEDAAAFAEAELERIKRQHGTAITPLSLTPVSAWAKAPPPKPREWILEGMIPAGRVTSLLGAGGLGKTLVALQIALHVSLGRSLFGIAVKGGPVLGIFCEDEEDELNRRLRAACEAERLTLEDADRLVAISRDGYDNVLATFDHDHIRMTGFHAQVEATIREMRPTLVIIDTLADTFAGDLLNTTHARQFIKVALGGLCVRYGCAILLLAHPSKAGLASGEGDGFSGAWSNSVRSRLYVSRPKAPDAPDGEPSTDVLDRLVFEVKKANYSKGDVRLPLRYESGAFVLDADPIVGSIGPSAARTKTARVAMGALDVIRAKNPAVVPFKELFESLQAAGHLPTGSYDEHRKPLSRALRQLVADGMVIETPTPRGYRLNPELR